MKPSNAIKNMLSIVGSTSLKRGRKYTIEGDVKAVIYACSKEEELKQLIQLNARCVSTRNDNIIKYKVIEMVKRLNKHLKFEILCQHCFWVLQNEFMKNILERYILPRWRKDFK
ncbi:hypothetical protein QJS10_CPB18g00733 [Acorus calamus]|uniref:Uncharacterized protein n=1 Tax=Acorus calamus TaxID=4465 RepID=A0AAV9CLB4_ACOCL|nr:hypothetical protein QJS10_CPB18g00733 [Acorus calamus]